MLLNRVLREAGLLAVRPGPFGEILDTFGSRAFAVCDHQLAHVYVARTGRSRAGPRARSPRRPAWRACWRARSAARSAWTTRAPATWSRWPSPTPGSPIRTGWTTAWPPTSPGPWTSTASPATTRASCSSTRRCSGPRGEPSRRLLQKKLGFRTLFDVIPLDPTWCGAATASAPPGRGSADPDRRRAAAPAADGTIPLPDVHGLLLRAHVAADSRGTSQIAAPAHGLPKFFGERHNQGEAADRDPPAAAGRYSRARPCLAPDVASCDRPGPRDARPRAGLRLGRRHPRGGRAGHPRRGPLPQVAAAARRLLARGRGAGQDRDDQPGDPGPADRRREGRLAGDPEALELPPQASARAAPQHLRHRPPDDGLRRRRARARPAADRRQRRLAGAGPDQARRPRPLARLVDLLRHQDAGTATTRTPSMPCWACTPPARSACRSSPRSGPCRATTGSGTRTATGAGPTRPTSPRRPPPA